MTNSYTREQNYRYYMAEERTLNQRIDKGNQFIDELNACIEFSAYYNGNEERELAEQMLKEHLSTFDEKSMEVSRRNYYIIKGMQEEYGIA